MVQQKSEQKTSWVWYLLPVFFNIVGGIIGYVLLKDKDKKTAKMLIWVGVILLIVEFLIGLLNGLAGL